jgi:hypothetical protein
VHDELCVMSSETIFFLLLGETEKDEEEADTPWEGAIIFKRSAVQARVEYVTSLERLGLSILSSELSRALALSMGLLNELESETEELVTPVQISIDASREGRDIQLDGIIRTAFGLVCNRCLAPVAERVFATFNLTLTMNPVSEPPQNSGSGARGRHKQQIWI